MAATRAWVAWRLALASVTVLPAACSGGGRATVSSLAPRTVVTAGTQTTSTTSLFPASPTTAATTPTTTTTTTATTIQETSTTEGTTTTSPAPDPARPCGWSAQPPQAYDHVIWIWMENKNASILTAR